MKNLFTYILIVFISFFSFNSNAQTIIGQGVTTSNGWVNYNPAPAGQTGIYMDVNTSACGFTATPHYIATLEGDGAHFHANGINAVYNPTPNGFRVYLRWTDSESDSLVTSGNLPIILDNTVSTQFNWRVRWTGIQTTNCSNNGNSAQILPGEKSAYNDSPVDVIESNKQSSTSEELHLYPNPATSNLVIKGIPDAEGFEIYTIGGTLVDFTNSRNIDISNLANGTYIIKALSSKSVISKRFVKE